MLWREIRRNINVRNDEERRYINSEFSENLYPGMIKGVRFELNDFKGEASGYIINDLDKWKNNKKATFLALDEVSQLLEGFHYVLFKDILKVLTRKDGFEGMQEQVLFLNRVYFEENTYEQHENFMKRLQELFSAIVYSFGSTELYDEDFPENVTDEFMEDVEKRYLTKAKGWKLDSELGSYYVWISDNK